MKNDNINYELLNRIIKCIHQHFEFSKDAFEKLSLSTDINRDLGIEGDDANELMPDFFEQFSVNIEHYDPYRYFVPEGYDFFSFTRDKDRRGKIPMRLGMMYLAAESKKWDAPVLEAISYSSAPLYSCTAEVPLTGFEINRR